MTPTEKLQKQKTQSKELRAKWDNLQKEISETVIEIYKQHIKYKDVVEKVRVAPRKFENQTHKVGYVEYVENFKDEDTGELIPITRCHFVWRNGEWYKTQDMEFCLTHLIDK